MTTMMGMTSTMINTLIPITSELIQQMMVFLGLFYLFTNTPTFRDLIKNQLNIRQRALIFLVFFAYFLLIADFSHANNTVVNIGIIGVVLGGLLGGWQVGFFVSVAFFFLTEGNSSSGFLLTVYAFIIICEGVAIGFIRDYFVSKNPGKLIFDLYKVTLIALAAEIIHILALLFTQEINPDSSDASLKLIDMMPMLFVTPLGVALIIMTIKNQRRHYELKSNHRKALKIAKQSTGMEADFDSESSQFFAKIIKETTGVSEVAITNTTEILAFTGKGDDFYKPCSPIKSIETLETIKNNKVTLSEEKNPNSVYPNNLGAVLVIPLKKDNGKKVFGTINLYEPKDRLFLNINKGLGLEISELISSQIVSAQFREEKRRHQEKEKRLIEEESLRRKEEIKRMEAQINPHFLFNALNTICSFTQTDPEKAEQLLMHLSSYFRKNLNRSGAVLVTLKEELAHIDSYLMIEKARHGSRLQIERDIPEALMHYKLPVLALQNIIENAIKHGISEMLQGGKISIYGTKTAKGYLLTIEDNAGLYLKKDKASCGIGLENTKKRIRNLLGHGAELTITCEPQQWTKVSLYLPEKAIIE